MTAVANAANRISPDETIQGIQAVLSLPDLDFHVPPRSNLRTDCAG